jgi:hypothetical protein
MKGLSNAFMILGVAGFAYVALCFAVGASESDSASNRWDGGGSASATPFADQLLHYMLPAIIVGVLGILVSLTLKAILHEVEKSKAKKQQQLNNSNSQNNGN